MQLSPPTRAAAIATTGTIVAAGAGYLHNAQPDCALLVIPTAVAAWLIFTIGQGYHIIRSYRWRERRTFEADQVRALVSLADVADPTVFPGVAVINKAQHALLPTVPDRQAAMYGRGVVVAAMPTVAVLLAALQTTAATPASPFASGLSLASGAVMATLIALVWRSRNPSQPWVRARTRAELLRREQYLCLARVGPYQNQTSDQITATSHHRIATIKTAPDDQLDRLISLRDSDQATDWRDHLFSYPNQSLDQLGERARAYLHYRIDKQLLWFIRNRDHHRRLERHISTITKAALITAVAATLAQTALHLAEQGNPIVTAGIDVTTLVLPPGCAFLLAIQELFSHRRLAAAYHDMATQLDHHRTVLTAQLDHPDPDPISDSRQFQLTVLHTETALTVELRHWRLITQRDEYDLSI
jgi:hypothetical protein